MLVRQALTMVNLAWASKGNNPILKKSSLPSVPFLEVQLGNAFKNISESENIPSIPKSVQLGVAEPQPFLVLELERSPGAPLQDPTATTGPLTGPLTGSQVPFLHSETNLAKQVPILQGLG